MARMIPLSQGYSVLVDDDDFVKLSQWKWSLHENGERTAIAACRNAGKVNGKQKIVLMHREIMMAPPGFEVDHINRNTLDNRKCNLRLCDKVQNNRNKGIRANNLSGFKGVRRHREGWQALIMDKQKCFCLGTYITKQEAAFVYDAAALRLHGEFACTNKSLGLL